MLDCDNVLWGGILSEDGIEGIKLGLGFGQPYQEFQCFLLMLYCHGVILTVCSKNDEADVKNVFRKHSGMILREEHIACYKVNWNNKAENIKMIAEELNIGLDSMVFVDDSLFEINLITTILPEVTSIHFDPKTIYDRLSCFSLQRHIDLTRVKDRYKTFQTNAERILLKKSCICYDDYLLELKTTLDIHPAFMSELARISELTQRTNKCTNGIRYTLNQLKKKLQQENYLLCSVYVTDKFSSLGLVGAIGISDKELDLFVLSCRALGRNIENQMLDYALNIGINKYSFQNTGKNSDLDNLLKNNVRNIAKI